MWMEERNDQIHLKGEALGGFLKPDCWEGRKVAGEGDSPGRRRKRGAQALPKKRGRYNGSSSPRWNPAEERRRRRRRHLLCCGGLRSLRSGLKPPRVPFPSPLAGATGSRSLRLVFFIPRRLRPQSPATLAGALWLPLSRGAGTLSRLYFPPPFFPVAPRPSELVPPPELPRVARVKAPPLHTPRKPSPYKISTGGRGDWPAPRPLPSVMQHAREGLAKSSVHAAALPPRSAPKNLPLPLFTYCFKAKRLSLCRNSGLQRRERRSLGGKGRGIRRGQLSQLGSSDGLALDFGRTGWLLFPFLSFPLGHWVTVLRAFTAYGTTTPNSFLSLSLSPSPPTFRLSPCMGSAPLQIRQQPARKWRARLGF